MKIIPCSTEFLQGDVGGVQGNNFVSRSIRYFETSHAETESNEITTVNHSFMITSPGNLFTANLSEADWKLRTTPLTQYRFTPTCVHRMIGITDKQREELAIEMALKIGQSYGVFKLFAHLVDGLISKIPGTGRSPRVMRRLCFVESMPICSQAVALCYRDVLGYEFGMDANEITPDGITDWCNKHPKEWARIV